MPNLPHCPTRRGQAVAPATIRAARADLQGFITWWEADHQLRFDVALVLDQDLRRWQLTRQHDDGAKPATLNRALVSLRAFFIWAQREKLISHNPAADLHDLPLHDIAPRSVPPALDWLLRAIAAQDVTARLRDLALLALLSDCGLLAQEAADVQLRDLDLDGAMLTVRSGKGRNARRVPLTAGVVRMLRDYLKRRCPNGQPQIGSEGEHEPLLMKRSVAKAGQPWEPGLTPNAMRKHLTALGRAAADRLEAQAVKESSLERIAELEALARQVAAISPHPLRPGLSDVEDG